MKNNELKVCVAEREMQNEDRRVTLDGVCVTPEYECVCVQLAGREKGNHGQRICSAVFYFIGLLIASP